MPYIKDYQRNIFDPIIKQFPVLTEGELNYIITKLLIKNVGPNPSYTKLNSLMGVLSCAGSEFYRRVVIPYEELKSKENGDVY